MEIIHKADPAVKKVVKVFGIAKKWLMTQPEIEVYKPKPQTQPLVLSARLRSRPGVAAGAVGGNDASLSERSTSTSLKTVSLEPGVAAGVALLRDGHIALTQLMPRLLLFQGCDGHGLTYEAMRDHLIALRIT